MTAPANPFAQAPAPAAPPAPANPFAQAPAPAAAPAPVQQFAQAPAAPAPAPAPANPFTTQPAAPVQQFAQPAPAPAPAQPFAAQPAAAPAQPVAGDPFGDPAPQINRPRIRDLYGRLLLIRPFKVEQVSRRQKDGSSKLQDRMTADVIVLDGGPLHYGGNPEELNGRPHDKVVAVPYRVEAMFISSVGVISQSREALAKRQQGQPGMVLGRLTVGQASTPDQNAPYLLEAATDAEKQIARQYLATVDPFA